MHFVTMCHDNQKQIEFFVRFPLKKILFLSLPHQNVQRVSAHVLFPIKRNFFFRIYVFIIHHNGENTITLQIYIYFIFDRFFSSKKRKKYFI